MDDAVQAALKAFDNGNAERAKVLLSAFLSRGPVREKIEDYVAIVRRIDAAQGSKEFRTRMRSEDVPQLTAAEARAVHLFAATSLRQALEMSLTERSDTRCGDRGSDTLLQLVALNGHAPSQFLMGTLLASGSPCGWEHDAAEAAHWYAKAAEQGHEQAKVNYASALLIGEGIPKNEARAVELLTEGANGGNARAQYLLGVLHVGGHSIRKSQRTAIRLFRSAAEQGFFAAQTSLGKILWERAVVEKEWDDAREWLRKAAEQGDPEAQYRLGRAYVSGVDGEFWRFDEANQWLTEAAERGHIEAQTSLGLQYWEGDRRTGSMPPRPEDAVRWLRAAAEQGQSTAQTYLGFAYATGKGVPEDHATAISWWRKAAKQNNSRAEEALGWAYAKGHGVPRDDAQAREWYRRAAAHGSMGAKDWLTADAKAVMGGETTRLSLGESIAQIAIVYIGAAILFGGGSGDFEPTPFCAGPFSCDVGQNHLQLSYAVGALP